jgi:hypothetical protein
MARQLSKQTFGVPSAEVGVRIDDSYQSSAAQAAHFRYINSRSRPPSYGRNISNLASWARIKDTKPNEHDNETKDTETRAKGGCEVRAYRG